MADWDATNPADDDIVSQYPANERAAREAVLDNFGINHHEQDDAEVGMHEAIQMLNQVPVGVPDVPANGAAIWAAAGRLRMREDAGGASREIDAFPSGTRMVFYQADAPLNWSRVSWGAGANIHMVGVSSSGTAGGIDGTWTISGMTVANHTLTLAQIPSHNHGGGGNTGSNGSHSHSGTATANGNHNHGGSTGSNGTHNHGGSTGGAGAHSHTYISMEGTGTVGDEDSDGQRGPQSTSSVPNHDHSIANDGNHSHSISNSGTHTHSLDINNNGNHNHTYSIPSNGSGNAHNHGISQNGSWRPLHIHCLVAEKD